MVFSGKITSAEGRQDRWDGYRVVVTRSAAVDDVVKAIEQSIAVREDGSYLVELGNPIPTDAVISVFAPTGQVVGQSKFVDLREPDGSLRLKPLVVKRPELGLEIDPAEPPKDLRTRISGRVFVVTAGSLDRTAAAALEVRIFGDIREGPVGVPIFSGVTDRNGYFAGTAMRQILATAVAETGTGTETVRHPLQLTSEAWLPEPILLFIEAKAGAEDKCGCEAAPPPTPSATELAVNGESFAADLGAGCQDFTVPNRTLEEFDFFKIVRTTDPTIKGLTLPDTVRNELDLPEVVTLAFDRATLAQAVGASSMALLNAPKPVTEVLVSSDLRRASRLNADGARTMARLATAASGLDAPAAKALADTGVADYLNVSQLEASGTRKAAEWGRAVEEKATQAAVKAAVARIPPAALRVALEDPDGFTPESLMTLERRVSAQALATYLKWRRKPVTSRGELNEANLMDWDETPEFCQATSIAHGHILHFKQEWRADGYSLGELVRSIPLAPGQKKQIAVVEWDRQDTAARTEATDSSEALSATLSRDRDIDEIANVAFSESLRGGSSASTSAVGGGFGLAIGPLVIGGGGGAAKASSTAWSDNSRNMSGQTLNQLRDRVSQGATAVRNQRSTVVSTVGQRERVTATTEVIANYNRCHALTIQYFEVLRHFAVHERIAGVQECLFVPLEMTTFDDAKVLRWYDILLNTCRDRRLTPGFEAIRRLNSPEALPPDRRYADDPIEEMTGRLRIRVAIARPKDPKDATEAVQQTEWRFFGWVLRVNPEVLYERYKRDQAKRDRIFRMEIAPEIANAFLESLRVMLVDRDGREHDAGFGITVASRYAENGVMEVDLNNTGAGPRLTRAQIAGVSIQTDFELPEFSKIVVESADVTYATERFSGSLFGGTVNDDVVKGDPAFLSSSQLSRAEERNQLAEMRKLRRRLLRYLNDHIEYSHRSIWLAMDSNRRFMLLDGFEAPRSGGRSVASVVENRLVGIVGNCLVMPVAAGFQLDPVLAEALKAEEDPQKALERLYEVEPAPPRRLSVPTKGVFAEAMPGKCNSCEVIEEDRFWRWKDYPLPDSPSAIGAVSTDSRFAAPGSLRPTALPDALVKFQQIPNAPDPTAMSAALNLLSQDVFKDLTGLTANQKNAMAALTTAMGTSEAFAGEAFKLAMAKDAAKNVDRTLEQIKAAKKADLLTPEEASKATRDALLRSIGESPASSQDVTTTPEVEAAIKKAAETPGGKATITRDKGETSESVSFNVDEAVLTVGTATGHVREYPIDIWVDVPLILDDVDTATRDYAVTAPIQNFESARKQMAVPFTPPGNPQVLVDLAGSLVNAGLLRRAGTGFQVRVKAMVGYPADPNNNQNILRPPANEKYRFVAMVHGQSGAWQFSGALTPTTTITGDARPVRTVPVTDREDYKGYAYLQMHLAQLAKPVVSISFSHALPNQLDSRVEMRSALLLAAIRQVMADASTAGTLLHDAVDFTATGLMGHSRGGEGVVRAFAAQQATAIAGLRVKAVCSLAPTDYLGASDNVDVNNHSFKLSLPAQASVSYLVVYGGLDGDVSGLRVQGNVDFGGSGFRLYDRSECDRAMVFIPFATHDRFNSVWAPHITTVEWKTAASGITLPGLPDRALNEATHQALAREFIGGFFDLILNGNANEQARFRNELRSPTGASIAHQWHFASATEPLDNFGNPATPDLGTRTLPANATVGVMVPISPANERDEKVPHDDSACILSTTTAGTRSVVYDVAGNAPTGFEAVRFRLGVVYPFVARTAIAGTITPGSPVTIDVPALRTAISNVQTAIGNVNPPNLAVVFEDVSGQTARVAQATILSNQSNGWARPAAKVPLDTDQAGQLIGGDATLMFLQTMQVLSTQIPGIDQSRLRRITFEFTVPAAATEIWLDSIDIVIN